MEALEAVLVDKERVLRDRAYEVDFLEAKREELQASLQEVNDDFIRLSEEREKYQAHLGALENSVSIGIQATPYTDISTTQTELTGRMSVFRTDGAQFAEKIL